VGCSAVAGALPPPLPWPSPSSDDVLCSSSSVGTAEPQVVSSPHGSGVTPRTCLAHWDIITDLLDGTSSVGEIMSSWEVLWGVSRLALGHLDPVQFCDSSICRCWILPFSREAEGFNNTKSNKLPTGVKRAVWSASLRKAPKHGLQDRGELERQLKIPTSSATCSHAAHTAGCRPVLRFNKSAGCFRGAEPRYLLVDQTAASQLIRALSQSCK